MSYWHNVNEAICGEPNRAMRIKLFRYRARAVHGSKPRRRRFIT